MMNCSECGDELTDNYKIRYDDEDEVMYPVCEGCFKGYMFTGEQPNLIKMPYKFSPTSLSLLKECHRCFWLKFNKDIKDIKNKSEENLKK